MRFYNCKYFKKSATFFKASYTHIVGFSIVAFCSQFFFLFPQISLDLSIFLVPTSFLGTQLMTFLTNFRKPTTKNDKYKILKSFIRRIYYFSNKITVEGFRSHVYRRKSHNWKSYNMCIEGFEKGCGFFKVLTIVKSHLWF